MKRSITVLMTLAMAFTFASCSQSDDSHEYSSASLFDKDAYSESDAAAESAAEPESAAEQTSAAARAVTEISLPQATTMETNAAPLKTTTEQTTTFEQTTTTKRTTTTKQTTTTASAPQTTTTTTTEAPKLLPTVSGSGTAMNGNVILKVTGDPNTGVITLDIENNYSGSIMLFRVPALVVDGYSVSLDNPANMMVLWNEAPANAKVLIELNAQPDQIKSGMRITGELNAKTPGYHTDMNFDITLN